MAASDKQAAYTEPHGPYPGYLSVRDDGHLMVVTLREAGTHGLGKSVVLAIPRSAFRRLLGEMKDKFRG